MELNFYILLSFSITLLVLILSSWHDIKKREVPNVITYTFIVVGILFNIILSVVFFDPHYIINSIAGFLVYSLIGFLLFYFGLWGGGDLKVVAGIGGMVGVDIVMFYKNIIQVDLGNILGTVSVIFTHVPLFVIFFIASFFSGALIGIVYSFVIAVKNRNHFLEKFSKMVRKYWIHYIAVLLLITSAVLFFINIQFRIVSIFLTLIIVSMYLIIFVKVIEDIGFKKEIKPKELTEGDWLVHNIEVDGKVVVKRSNEGISVEEIKTLMKLEEEKKIEKITIKEGMPFLPSLLSGFIIAGIIFFVL